MKWQQILGQIDKFKKWRFFGRMHFVIMFRNLAMQTYSMQVLTRYDHSYAAIFVLSTCISLSTCENEIPQALNFHHNTVLTFLQYDKLKASVEIRTDSKLLFIVVVIYFSRYNVVTRFIGNYLIYKCYSEYISFQSAKQVGTLKHSFRRGKKLRDTKRAKKRERTHKPSNG